MQGVSNFPAIDEEGLGEFEDGVAVEGEGAVEEGFQVIAEVASGGEQRQG